MSEYRWFRYVRHAEREQAKAEGWVFSADLGHPHGYWSTLMEWGMDSAPPRPAGVPSPLERFEEAIAAYEAAQISGRADEIGFARRQLAEVAWNLKHAIVDGLKAAKVYNQTG